MELQAYEKEHLDALSSYLGECMVLLKSSGAFPIAEAGKVALFGNGIRKTVKGGTGSGEVNSRFSVNVEEGFRNEGFTITSTSWLNAYDDIFVQAKKDFGVTLKQRAKEHHTMVMLEAMGAIMPEPEYTLPLTGEGDVAVYVLSRICGEGNDRSFVRGDVLLTETERRDICELQKKYAKFLLVLNVGGPVDLSEIPEVENILILSQLGVHTGTALAQVVLGKIYPSGKLTTTWTAAGDYQTIGEFGDRDNTRYKEGIYVGYRYFDTVGRKPMFPFGYGLGYTTFDMTPGEVTADGTKITVKASVKNTGARPGKEVVQVYVASPDGKLDKPAKALAGFAKTAELAAGEEQEVAVTFDLKDMASYDEETAQYILEAGEYAVCVGTSSASADVSAVLTLDHTVVTLQCRNIAGKPDFKDWKPETKTAVVIPEDAQRIAIDAYAIRTATVEYDKEEEIDPDVDKLNADQLMYLNIGAFNPKGGLTSVIGSAAQTVAGAAGETTLLLKDQGIDQSIVMADGPAGLRLSKTYVKDSKGALHSIGAGLPGGMDEYAPAPVKLVFKLMDRKPKKGEEILHQYCTAIPIGTGIAQSWNLEFAELCGDIVGDEMERFGVHMWLAPALNIHRSILCGRNFEYYSEDPLISGAFAAAITKGVQKHPGKSTTIKHYCANSQETNRYNSNSLVSERAMREIYLKGFEICVKESQPHALMTSYNLLNGTHTSERRDLIQDALRSEWGYEGIVMTDWVIAGGVLGKGSFHRAAEAGHVAAAGGDLFMPGDLSDFKDMQAKLADGTLTEKQLKINGTRTLRMIRKLNA